MTLHDPLSFLGNSFVFRDSREESLKNIKLIIRLRFFLSPAIFLILSVAGLAGLSTQKGLTMNQIVVNGTNTAVMLLLNLVYTVLLKKLEDLKPLVLFQLFIDVVYVSLTVYKTGGVTSPFTFLYFIAIFSASIIVSGNTGFLIAGISSVFFSGMIILENQHILPHQDFFSPFVGLRKNVSYITLVWIFTIFSFFVFAALASYLTGIIHKRQAELRNVNDVLRKKNETMILLYKTSKALNSYTSVSLVVDYILSELISHLQLDRAILYLNIRNEYLHLYRVKFNPAAKEGNGTMNIKVDMPLNEQAGLTARAALYREAYNIQNPEDSPHINKELASRIGMNPFAVAPLILRNSVVGVIGVDRSLKNGSISDEEFQILQMFANQAAITISSLENVDSEFRASYGM